MYKIEPHLHTTHVSRCGRLEAKEIVAGYKAAGYSALIVTDHFNRTTFEHLGIDPAGKSDRIGAFLEGYRRVREEGERQGLRVFKGAELRCRIDLDAEDLVITSAHFHQLHAAAILRRNPVGGIHKYQVIRIQWQVLCDRAAFQVQ